MHSVRRSYAFLNDQSQNRIILPTPIKVEMFLETFFFLFPTSFSGRFTVIIFKLFDSNTGTITSNRKPRQNLQPVRKEID